MIERYGPMIIKICLELESRVENEILTYGVLYDQYKKIIKVFDITENFGESNIKDKINQVLRNLSDGFRKYEIERNDCLKDQDVTTTVKSIKKIQLKVNNAILEKYVNEKKKNEDMQKLMQQTNEYVKNIKKILENREIKYNLVESSPIVRSLKEHIDSMIGNVEEQGTICITGYFDNCLLSDLKSAMDDKQVTVKIIHPTIRKGKDRAEDRRNLDALNRIIDKGIGAVRYSDLVHARIFLMDNEVIVSSADMKNNSLGGAHFEAGIYSNDLLMVEKVKDFFERIWNESQEKS